MRWLALVALTLGAACDYDELPDFRAGVPEEAVEDLPSSDHGSRAERMSLEPAKEALDEQNREVFLREIGQSLEAMEQWATNFEQGLTTGYGGSDEVRTAFRGFQAELAEAQAMYVGIARGEGLPERPAEALYERTVDLLAASRRITAARRESLGVPQGT